MAKFRIQSTETGHFLISNNLESDGSAVETVPKKEFNPFNNILLIDPPVGPVPLTGFVQSSRVPGLYVGYKTIENESTLTWTKEKFPWIFTATGEWVQYNIKPANGEDLYWFDKFNTNIDRCIVLRPGSQVKKLENSFTITHA